jgi:hypothetical protein
VPRYYFHIRTASHTLCHDADGTECESDARARRWALNGAGYVKIGPNLLTMPYRFEVVDQTGRLVFDLPFAELLRGCQDLPKRDQKSQPKPTRKSTKLLSRKRSLCGSGT